MNQPSTNREQAIAGAVQQCSVLVATGWCPAQLAAPTRLFGTQWDIQHTTASVPAAVTAYGSEKDGRVSAQPKRPEHSDKTEHVGNGYVIVRKLVGYGSNAKVNITPQYRWELRLNGRLVDEDSRRTPLRRAARRDDYRERA